MVNTRLTGMRLARSAEAWSALWAASGAAGLSGRRDGPPLDVPLALVRTASEAAATINRHAAQYGIELEVDGPAILAERAAIAGFVRSGTTSCGGGTRLLQASGGWMAVSLARDADVGSLPAWLGSDEAALTADDPEVVWSAVERLVPQHQRGELVERAVLLGMPVASLGEVSRQSSGGGDGESIGTAEPVRSLAGRVVLDLSSLWAGPLCAQLLGSAGMRVIKVESEHRPDGARNGPHAFFDLLHGGQESVALDLRRPDEQRVLADLLTKADVVIEGSRPRALRQLGITAPPAGTQVWVSITGHGRSGDAGHRVGFGDDAAVAAGLVTGEPDDPCFCVDAVADPLTGLTAAALVLDRLLAGGRWMLDVSLSATAAKAARGPSTTIAGYDIAPARARVASSAAPSLGQHTSSVLGEFDVAR